MGPYDHLHSQVQISPTEWTLNVSLEGALLDDIVLLKGSPQSGHIVPRMKAWHG